MPERDVFLVFFYIEKTCSVRRTKTCCEKRKKNGKS